MDARILALAAAAVLAAGCDTSGRDAGLDPEAGTAKAIDKEIAPRDARTGSVRIGDQQYNFDIGLCSIQQPSSMKQFMLVGRGVTEDGRRFTVNADGSAQVTAIVVRISGNYGPVARYTARVAPEQVRIEDRTISAIGEFGVGTQPRQPGQFSARCTPSDRTQENANGAAI